MCAHRLKHCMWVWWQMTLHAACLCATCGVFESAPPHTTLCRQTTPRRLCGRHSRVLPSLINHTLARLRSVSPNTSVTRTSTAPFRPSSLSPARCMQQGGRAGAEHEWRGGEQEQPACYTPPVCEFCSYTTAHVFPQVERLQA